MNPRRSFVRKIVYLAAIAVLLVPLYWLSQPATGVVEEIDGVRQVVRGSPGGKLAQLRTYHELSEAHLGDLDPVGETMKLATFGLRGLATNILWEKALNYQKKKDWTNLSATLNQIAKLEPHFIAVWKHQAWNLSYNVSVEFDNYRDRYHWVIEGIKFLKRGVELNRREPRLLWDVGWFTAQKIGRADEAKQFRKLFREDDDFHAEDEEYGGSRPPEFRDNWLVGKYWFGRADQAGVEKGRPGMARIRHPRTARRQGRNNPPKRSGNAPGDDQEAQRGAGQARAGRSRFDLPAEAALADGPAARSPRHAPGPAHRGAVPARPRGCPGRGRHPAGSRPEDHRP